MTRTAQRRTDPSVTRPEEEFARLSEPYRRELLAYCYRMLGSIHDAEDLVQEIYLQAWRGYGGFEERSSLRTWLYRIATRACLKALEGKGRRPLPSSALQRARAQLSQIALTEDGIAEPTDPDLRALLDRYAAVFENADIAALMGVLTDDAVWEMPPIPTWYAGREAVGWFLAARIVAARDYRMVSASVNGQPAFGSYARDHDGVYRPHALQVLTVTTTGIARIVAFLDADLFPLCGLPPAADATGDAAV
jgi:RNA polymerase sigma factor (sigma-70 family)